MHPTNKISKSATNPHTYYGSGFFSLNDLDICNFAHVFLSSQNTISLVDIAELDHPIQEF
jgi:hypothetical protein